MNLISQNLCLRKSTFGDCTVFAEWEKDPKVTEFFTMEADRDYEQVVLEYVKRLSDPTQVQFTICQKEDDIPIGRVHISRLDDHYHSFDITRIYIGRTDLRGKGLGEEALRLVLFYGFEERNCERVTLDHFTGNKIAAALYLKVGFQYEGVMRHAGRKNGEYLDLHLMSMLRNEYFDRKK